MKYILSILFSAFIICAVQSQDVAVVSLYGMAINPEEEDNPTYLFEKSLDDNAIYTNAIQGKLDAIMEELGGQFNLIADDFLQESSYKYLLDEYEYAPENVKYSLLGYDLETLEDIKQDYRLSENQVIFYPNYLAIGEGKPFNNKAAIENLIDELTDVEAIAFVTFSSSTGFSGSPYGVGQASARVTMRVKLVSRSNKKLFAINVSGTSTSRIEVGLHGDHDQEAAQKAFEEAVDKLIDNMDKKMSKKVSKIKW